jgi:hypothetical protein
MIRLFITVLLLLALSACAALDRPDTPATLQAESAALATEAAELATLSSQQATSGMERIASLGTQSAFTSGINAQLAGTLGAVVTPTQSLSDFGAPVVSGASTPQPGQAVYNLTGLTDFVNEADGCIIGQRAVYDDSFPYVTATLTAFSLPRGTTFRAEWFFEDTLKASDSWVSDGDYEQICVWFRMEQSRTAFTLGRWTVRIFANDTLIGTPMDFEIAETAPNSLRNR